MTLDQELRKAWEDFLAEVKTKLREIETLEEEARSTKDATKMAVANEALKKLFKIVVDVDQQTDAIREKYKGVDKKQE